MSDDNVTLWIEGLKAGEEDAVQQIWDRYFGKLVYLARRKLGASDRRVSDEEDVAISAFHSLCVRAADGRLMVDSRDDLWKLLVVITIRKSYARLKYNNASKRGGGNLRLTLIGGDFSDGEPQQAIDLMASDEPSPDMIAAFSETCSRMLEGLDESQREIALLKMQGYTNEEIAERLNCSTRRVTRKLTLIRQQWALEQTG